MALSFKFVGRDAVVLDGHGGVNVGDLVTARDAAQAEEFDARDDFERVTTKKTAASRTDNEES